MPLWGKHKPVLTNKTVLVGVSGGIAAYKAVELVSRLVKLGAEVHVLMTPAATRLVAPLTFQALSGHPVQTDLLAEQRYGHVDHVYLARRADLLIVAPCTANTLAGLAAGAAGDPVTAAALGVACPVLVCPAMEEHMWAHPLTRANAERLRRIGYHLLEPREGRLASGLSGRGRLPEPEEIVAAALQLMAPPPQDLAGRRVLVTAGATREPLDPVRFISNRSSGKMGFAVAAAAAARGAEVVLVAGPGSLPAPPGVELVRVETALEMHGAVMLRSDWYQVAVGAAAVSDYRPAVCHPHKVKKQDGPLTVEFVRNPDILRELGLKKRPGQVLVGFAAETENVVAYARRKLQEKNLDLIVANNVAEEGSGFATDTNRVTLIDRTGAVQELPLLAKEAVAAAIWDRVVALL